MDRQAAAEATRKMADGLKLILGELRLIRRLLDREEPLMMVGAMMDLTQVVMWCAEDLTTAFTTEGEHAIQPGEPSAESGDEA